MFCWYFLLFYFGRNSKCKSDSRLSQLKTFKRSFTWSLSQALRSLVFVKGSSRLPGHLPPPTTQLRALTGWELASGPYPGPGQGCLLPCCDQVQLHPTLHSPMQTRCPDFLQQAFHSPGVLSRRGVSVRGGSFFFWVGLRFLISKNEIRRWGFVSTHTRGGQ